jgi:hypothetical protein
VKHRCTIFHAQVGPVRILQKRAGTRYAEHVFLHPAGSAFHVVHFGAPGALFFMVTWHRYVFDKSASGHIMRNWSFTSGGICRSRSAF